MAHLGADTKTSEKGMSPGWDWSLREDNDASYVNTVKLHTVNSCSYRNEMSI